MTGGSWGARPADKADQRKSVVVAELSGDHTDVVLIKAEQWVRTLTQIRMLPVTANCPPEEL